MALNKEISQTFSFYVYLNKNFKGFCWFLFILCISTISGSIEAED